MRWPGFLWRCKTTARLSDVSVLSIHVELPVSFQNSLSSESTWSVLIKYPSDALLSFYPFQRIRFSTPWCGGVAGTLFSDYHNPSIKIIFILSHITSFYTIFFLMSYTLNFYIHRFCFISQFTRDPSGINTFLLKHDCQLVPIFHFVVLWEDLCQAEKTKAACWIHSWQKICEFKPWSMWVLTSKSKRQLILNTAAVTLKRSSSCSLFFSPHRGEVKLNWTILV